MNSFLRWLSDLTGYSARRECEALRLQLSTQTEIASVRGVQIDLLQRDNKELRERVAKLEERIDKDHAAAQNDLRSLVDHSLRMGGRRPLFSDDPDPAPDPRVFDQNSQRRRDNNVMDFWRSHRIAADAMSNNLEPSEFEKEDDDDGGLHPVAAGSDAAEAGA